MLEEALQAQPSADATTTSTPAVEENQKAEEGEIKDAPDGEAKEGEAKEEPKPLSEADKIRQSMQKRIDRQTAASKAREENFRRLETELNELRANAPKADSEPKQEDFDNYDKWQEAVIDHRAKLKADETLATQKESELKDAQQRQAAEVQKEFIAKETTFRAATPDYDRVAKEAVQTMTELGAAGANISLLRDVVMQFDNPPELIYELGKDTNLIEDLVNLPLLKIMRELVKLESALQGTKEEPKQAPKPIKPLGGKGSATKPLSSRSGKEILDWAKGKSK